MENRKGQRILDWKHEWRCGRPVRLNSRMKRENTKHEHIALDLDKMLDELLSSACKAW